MSELFHIDANWLLTSGSEPIRDSRLSVDRHSGRIVSITPLEEPLPEGEVYLLTPGLINAHTHLELYGEPIALAAGETMADWILKVVALSRQMLPEDKRQAAMKSLLEMVRSGVTTVNDITSTGESLEVLSQVGLRARVSPEFFYPWHDEAHDLTPLVERFQTLQSRFAGHPLLELGLSPHSPYNVNPQAACRSIKRLSPLSLHMHLAETEAERDWLLHGVSELDTVHQTLLGQTFGPTHSPVTPVDYYQDLWDERWTVVHGVHLGADDFKKLAQKGVKLVTCPRSNQWLSEQTIPDWSALKDSGIALGLGTDSALSCPTLDMRDEARALQQAHGLSAREVFEVATAGSASAIGWQDSVGRLIPEMQADLVLWKVTSKQHDPFEAWLSPEARPVHIWVGGRTVLERED